MGCRNLLSGLNSIWKPPFTHSWHTFPDCLSSALSKPFQGVSSLIFKNTYFLSIGGWILIESPAPPPKIGKITEQPDNQRRTMSTRKRNTPEGADVGHFWRERNGGCATCGKSLAQMRATQMTRMPSLKPPRCCVKIKAHFLIGVSFACHKEKTYSHLGPPHC